MFKNLVGFAFVALTAAALCGNVIAGDDEWVQIGSDARGSKWFGKIGSGKVGPLDKTEKSIQITYKFIDASKPKQITLGKLFANIKDCKKGEGRVYFANMDGNAFENDQFVIYGGTVASAMANSLCLTLDEINGVKSQREDEKAMWIEVSNTDDADFFIKKYTLEIIKNKNGRFAVATLKQFNKKKDSSIFEKAAVSSGDCAAQQGRIFFSKLDFSDSYSSNFVFDGGNAASTIAEALCPIFDSKIK